MTLQLCSAALSRALFCLARVSSSVRLGIIAGDGTTAAGIKSGSIHPYGIRRRRIGVHRLIPALDRLESGARIALAAIAPIGQATDQDDPVEVAPARVDLKVRVRVAQADQARARNGPARDAPRDLVQVVPNGPVLDVPRDPQSGQNGPAMHVRSDPRLVRSNLIGHRHHIRDRRRGRSRERAIAQRPGRNSKRAHSNVRVRSSSRGQTLNHHAEAVRINGLARREKIRSQEGPDSNGTTPIGLNSISVASAHSYRRVR